jgi:hypothetical protein
VLKHDVGGGSGTTIVVNAGDLRDASSLAQTSAQSLQELAGRIGSRAVPELPPEIASVVPAALAQAAALLGGMPGELGMTAQELRARAFWADAADRLAAGYELEDAMLEEFKAGMSTGVLAKYADPFTRELARKYFEELREREDPGGIGGFLEDVGGGIADFAEGAWDSIKDPAVMLYKLTPLNEDWTDQWSALGQGVAYGVTHPAEFGKAFLALDALEERGVAYWLGNLAPAAVAAVMTGGAGAAVRGAQGVTALERAGLTSAKIAGLTEKQAASVIMRGAKPVPGKLFAGEPPVPPQFLRDYRTPDELFSAEARNFDGPMTRVGPTQPDRWLANGHDAARNPLAERPERSFKYSGDPKELLQMSSKDEFSARYALPDDWGDRNTVSVLHVPEGQPGWSMSGKVAPQTSYGAQYVGGAQQHLLHSVHSSNVIWSGPFPWERVPDLGYAAHGAAQAAGAAGATSAVTNLPDFAGAHAR